MLAWQRSFGSGAQALSILQIGEPSSILTSIGMMPRVLSFPPSPPIAHHPLPTSPSFTPPNRLHPYIASSSMSPDNPPFPDLVGSIDLPHRRGKAGMSTLWIAPEHPLVPEALRDTGRVLVLIWKLRPSFMKAVYERAREAEAPHWSEDLANLGELSFQSMVRVYSCHCSFGHVLWRFTAIVLSSLVFLVFTTSPLCSCSKFICVVAAYSGDSICVVWECHLSSPPRPLAPSPPFYLCVHNIVSDFINH